MTDSDLTESGFNDRLLLACRREAVDRTPVWLMRQAGRYMPEYRKLRKKYSFDDLSTTPELAAKVTMMPVEQLGVDAAILFSDLLTPASCAGFKVEYREGGPFVNPVIKDEEGLERIKSVDLPRSAAHVVETIKMLRQQLKVPLIGFAGGPFTLASYLVEGGPSRHFEKLKTMIFEAPALAWNLFDALSELCFKFLELQIEAGAQVVQIFDTWAGVLSPADFGAFELPWLQRMAMALKRKGVPVIIYVNGVGGILDRLAESGADVVSIDWRVDIADARKVVGGVAGLQGNLDPAVLLGPEEVIVAKAREILTVMSGSPGFIFNLGHGILPQTELTKVELLVNTVREFAE